MKNSPALLCFLLLFISFIMFSGCATNSTRVMVKAWSQDNYRDSIPDGDLPPVETYMLVRGEYDSGSVRDDSLIEAKNFPDIAQYIEDALKTQNYRKAGPNEKLDLVIVAHWGQTTIETHMIFIDSDDEENLMGEDVYEQITPESLQRNSLILGTTDRIYKNMSSSEIEDAIAQTSEERYYFVLVAYDADKLVQRKKIPRWITQFSVDTSGLNYLDALPAMTDVAQDYFGKNLKDLSFKRKELNKGNVEFGELEFLGTED